MNNKTTQTDSYINYCMYPPNSPANNPLSRFLEKVAIVVIAPTYLVLPVLSVTFGVVESLPVEGVLFSFEKATGITVPYSVHKATYTGINTAVGFMIGLSTAMIIENPFVAIGIGTYCAGATFLGSLTMEEIPSADSKENEDFLNLVIKNCFSNGFSYVYSVIFATCPIILTAKTVDVLVEKMEAAGIVDYSLSRTPFTYIPEALYSAGGMAQEGYDRYPLHAAAALNQIYRAEVLLASIDESQKKRALTESDTEDSSTYTALNLASFHGQKEMVEFLAAQYVNLGISINTPDADGKTALMVASAKGHWEVFKILAKKYFELDLTMEEEDNAGNTAIHYIATALLFSTPSAKQLILYKQIIQTLTKNGVDLTALNHRGKSTLDIAESGDVSSVKAQKIAENIEIAHLAANLLQENLEITTLINRVIETMPNIKNEIGNGKQVTELLLQNNIEECTLDREVVAPAKENSNISYNIEESVTILHQEAELTGELVECGG